MDPFNQKLWREFWLMRGQALVVVMVIAAGVGIYVMARCTLLSLQRAQTDYYADYRFAHVFAHMVRAPSSLESRIAEIPGVAQVQTRLSVKVKIDIPEFREPATAKLISIPDRTPPELNRLHLRTGRYIESGSTGEVLISEAFANFHKLVPGDTVRAVINGRFRKLTVVGVALSPEFIFQIRDGDILPDDRRFAVFWMGRTELEAAFDLHGAFNDVTCTLMPGAVEAEVLQRLDQLTAPYGGLGAIGRADQSSHKFVNNEMQELRGMALVVPTIFLGISAFLLNIVVSRLIALQRPQVAALKAFGYTRAEIGWHYIKLVLLFVIFGVVMGTSVGAFFGQQITRFYARFFHFATFSFHLDPVVIISALGVTVFAAVLGTLTTVLRAVALPPAAAMHPEPPATFRPSILERLGFSRILTEPLKLVLRQLERRPLKSMLTCLGIALAVAVLILGSFMLDSIDYAISSQYYVAMHEDISIILTEPDSSRAIHAIESLPGVRYCEPFRAVAARLRCGARTRRVEVLGLTPAAELHRLMDIHCRKVPLPPDGLVLSQKLAEVLGLRIGDSVRLETFEGKRPEADLPVVGLITDFAGVAAYMQRGSMNRLMREGDVVSGAFVAADTGMLDRLYTELKNAPNVANILIKGSAIRSFRETIGENLLRMRSFIVFFATVIAVGVVFNSARIALAERSRELATLRVIGFTRQEISLLLLGELAILTAMAIPIGLLIGYGLAAFVIRYSYDTELFRMPLVVNRPTYAFAVMVILIAAGGSALVVRRMLDRLDLISVLKTKE